MTQLYLGFNNPGYTPGAWKGAWDDTAVAVTVPLNVDKEKEAFGQNQKLATIARAEVSADNDWDVALLRLVSPPLEGNQTISGVLTVVFACFESSGAANMFSHIHAWVSEGDTDTVRGTLVTDDISVTEWATSAAEGRASGPAISSVNALDGDRIIIEVGYRAVNTSTTSYTGTARYGSFSTQATDLQDQDDILDSPPSTHRNPWVDLSSDPVFEVATPRISQVAIEVGIDPNAPLLRVSQVAVEVGIVVIPPVRFSQVAIEVAIGGPLYTIPIPQPCVEPARYFIRLYDANGNLTAIIDEPKTFRIEHYVNGYSNCTLPVDELSPWVAKFNLDTIIEIWRRIGTTSYIEYTGLHRTPQRVFSEGRHRIFTSFSRGLLDLVNRRCILYKATTAYTLKGGSGEHVIKEYVNENLAVGANNILEYVPGTAINIGRVVNGTMPNFIVALDQDRGWYYAGQNSWSNVLATIQEIANITSVDFDVRLTSYKPLEFTFECYYPQLGSDKRATLKFSPELGNMAEPSYTLSRTEESNVVAVLGQGEGVYRKVVPQNTGAILDSPWNRCESTTDARGKDTMASYISSGQVALKERAAIENFEYKILQTSTAQYGIHYKLGDIVTGEYGVISRVKKIVGVAIDCADGVETIEITLGDLPVRP